METQRKLLLLYRTSFKSNRVSSSSDRVMGLDSYFFDSASFPKLTFHSESITKKSDTEFEIAGLMTIKGVEKPVVLAMDYAGVAVDPYGQTKAGMALTGKIKRSEFGLTWGAVTEAGNVVLGDDIHLNCEIQLVKQ